MIEKHIHTQEQTLSPIKIDGATGLIEGVSVALSPNHDERPLAVEVDLLVIHGISLPPGEFGSSDIEDFFCNRLQVSRHPSFATIAELKVSSHVVIYRDGTIRQYVPFNKRAWHAGQSSFKGRSNCNDFSIGIELEGTDRVSYRPIQYHRLIALTRELMKFYPKITPNHIVGHCHIAPGRKTDPGPFFKWHDYLASCKLDER